MQRVSVRLSSEQIEGEFTSFSRDRLMGFDAELDVGPCQRLEKPGVRELLSMKQEPDSDPSNQVAQVQENGLTFSWPRRPWSGSPRAAVD